MKLRKGLNQVICIFYILNKKVWRLKMKKTDKYIEYANEYQILYTKPFFWFGRDMWRLANFIKDLISHYVSGGNKRTNEEVSCN